MNWILNPCPHKTNKKQCITYVHFGILKNINLIHTKIYAVIFSFMFFYSGYILILQLKNVIAF